MRKCPQNELEVGMITAEPVKTHTGQLIVDANVPLTKKLIARIGFYAIDYIVVYNKKEKDVAKLAPHEEEVALEETILADAATEDESEDSEDSDALETEMEKKTEDLFAKHSMLHYEQKISPSGQSIIAEPSHSQKVKKSAEFQKFQLDFSFGAADLKRSFEAIADGAPVDEDALLKNVTSLIQPGLTKLQFFDMLHNMRQLDDQVYAHCINVALISRMIGKWLKFSKHDVDVLTLCGLLHDIGKSKIPAEVLNKKERLTDEEFALLQKHPQYGFDILKHQNIDLRIIKTAQMHHERCDGSGYPLHLKEDMIEPFAMIVAIADVYDAATSARTYRAALCPFECIANFERDGLQKYKPKYILTFLAHIATAYQNNRVILSNGESAKIVMLNPHVYSKPLVQLDDGTCIDLNRSDLYIKSMI